MNLLRKRKKENTHSQYSIQTLIINQERIGWSFLDIQPKSTLLVFDSHRLEGFKYFIVDNDDKIIDELLYNFRNCKVDDANVKINLCTMTFDSNVWDKLPKNKKKSIE